MQLSTGGIPIPGVVWTRVENLQIAISILYCGFPFLCALKQILNFGRKKGLVFHSSLPFMMNYFGSIFLVRAYVFNVLMLYRK